MALRSGNISNPPKEDRMSKIYLLKYGWGASSPEASVIIADNEIEAEKIATEELSEKLVKVIGDPRENGECDYEFTEYTIKEIPLEKGIIYTGYYCC
jgi:hypothetical protein